MDKMKKFLTTRLAKIIMVGLVLIGFSLYQSSKPHEVAKPSISLSKVLDLASAGKITTATLNETTRLLTVKYKLSKKTETAFYPALAGVDLAAQLEKYQVDVTVLPPIASNFLLSMFTVLLPILFLGLIMVLVLKSYSKTASKLGGKKGASVERPTVRFKDVAGADEAMEELQELVHFLKDPKTYTASGATAPKGVLLDGAPGTGKTLLARAVAGEANVPFYSVSGSDFVEMYAGVGASRVRELFTNARKDEKAIIFIDEIDAVGRRRAGQSTTPGDREMENTLNQLLVEMDGFNDSTVIVLASTNRPELLDSALTRPGRFDRKITIPLPDKAGRLAILQVHARKRVLSADADLNSIAQRTPGMSGADLANLLNTAAILSAKNQTKQITLENLNEALAQTVMGRARKNASLTDRDRLITAWHEAGHAILALLQENHPDPVQVTITPRGHAGGITWMSGSDESYATKSELEARLVTSLAGRAAEQLLLNGQFTQGAAQDLQAATNLALAMLTSWGMGDTDLLIIKDTDATAFEKSQVKANQMLQDALTQATQILTQNKQLLEATAQALLQEETLTLAQLNTLKKSISEK